jgi:inositol polyphosphate 5-phosphatase INPP5B/F
LHIFVILLLLFFVQTLQDSLVLRIERSFDQFADIKADYERSCYGMSLEELVQITQPVSEVPFPTVHPDFFLPSGQERGPGKIPSGNDPTPLSVPKELWRLIDALWSSNALKEKDLFNTTCAVEEEVAMIRLALDRGTEFGACCPQSLVEALLTLLSSLPRPLLPPDLYPTVCHC